MRATAVLHPAFGLPRRQSSMTPEQALDLALLGIAMAQPLALDRMVTLLQRVASPLLQPTAEVVEGRVQCLARRGLLAMADPGPSAAVVRRTAAGMRHARQLLRMPTPPRGAAHHGLVFMLKVCLLDLLVDSDSAAVVSELRRDLLEELRTAEHAARHCRCTSPFTRQWLARRVARLRDDLVWLEDLAAAGAASRPCPSGR
jgi:hypothetical protein